MSLLCALWPFLVGGLIGWLLCGLLARRLKYCDTQVETRVEKNVEVEKLIDNPEHIQRIGALENELKLWKQGPAIDLPAARAVGIKIGKEDDFSAIEGIGPKINELIHADGIHTFRELSEVAPSRIQTILDNAGSRYQMANPGTWPDQANLASSNRWPALKALQDILDGGVYPDLSVNKAAKVVTNEPEVVIQPLDLAAAKASGFRVKQKDNMDDFTVVEGIGPKINDLIHADGIQRYTDLANADVSRIQKILDNAGPSFRLAQPETWPAQSKLASTNSWQELKKWQDELDGGKA